VSNWEEDASIRMLLILLVVEETSNLSVSSDHHTTTAAARWGTDPEGGGRSGASGRNCAGRGGRGRGNSERLYGIQTIRFVARYIFDIFIRTTVVKNRRGSPDCFPSGTRAVSD